MDEVDLIEPPLGRKVVSLVRNVPVVDPDDAVSEVAARMTEAGSSSAVVRGASLGIVTDTDLRARVLAHRRSVDLAVAEVMTSPALTVAAESTLGDAMALMLEGGFQHLPVVQGEEVLGMLDARRLLAEVDPTPMRMGMGLAHAASGAEMALVVRRVPDAAEQLLASGMSALAVLRSVSSFVDAMTNRAIELAGPPPGDFAWVVLGSQARREQGLFADQGHALVIGLGRDEARYRAWAGRVVSILAEAGIPKSRQGMMASEPGWCRDQDGWTRWIGERLASTEPGSVTEAASATDARVVAGEPALGQVFSSLREGAARSSPFLGRLAAAATQFRVPVGLFGRLSDRFDIKQGAILPIAVIAQVYGLAVGSGAFGTVGRLDDAGRFGQLPPDLVDPLREGFEVAQRVRLEQHLDALRQGAPLDNGVDLERLSAWDETLLKEVFRAVKEAQSALEARFHAGHGR